MTVRRILDTVGRSDGSQLEELAGRALASPPPYRPVPSGPLCHIQIEDGVVMAAEHDLDGSLLDWSLPCCRGRGGMRAAG
jgi:hypothetical protein